MTRAESWTEQRSGLSKRAELEIAGDDTAKGVSDPVHARSNTLGPSTLKLWNDAEPDEITCS
jgi:hypothetical protein